MLPCRVVDRNDGPSAPPRGIDGRLDDHPPFASAKGTFSGLRGEMARRGVTYAQLVERLAAIGVDENERNLRNKVSRGKFTAGFLLQCLTALGCSHLQLD
jgi:hypothetical protein